MLRALFGSALFVALYACSSTTTFSSFADGGPGETTPSDDDGDGADDASTDAARRARDAGRDARARDAAAAEDSAVVVPQPTDPACDATQVSMPIYDYVDYTTRSSALLVPYSYDILVSGVRGDGNSSGDVVPQWFSFTVDTPRAATVSFSGSRCFMAMYFEAETASRVSLGTFGASSGSIALEAGTYYVQVDDSFKRYFGAGPSWEFRLTWDAPPPQCADAGP